MTVPALDLAYPFSGRWLVQSSPADRVPSHGIALFGTTFAIDFVPLGESGDANPLGVADFFRPEPPLRFTGFGRTITAPIAGTVVATHAAEPDHDSYRGLPSVAYAATAARRARAGWQGLAGNHLAIEVEPYVLVVLCHLRQFSVTVAPGQRVEQGQPLASCGNSGNSTEPHLHLQAVDRLGAAAVALPITFAGRLPRNGDIIELG